MIQANNEDGKKARFMCEEIDGYLFDMKRAMDVYIGLVRRESPDSVSAVEEQFKKVLGDIEALQEQGKEEGTPDRLAVLNSAVALCVDTLKRVEVAVNQFSQTQITVEAK